MILPFQTLRYTSTMRPDEVVSVLRANVGEPPKWFKRPPQPYIGSVDGYSFNIRRNIRRQKLVSAYASWHDRGGTSRK